MMQTFACAHHLWSWQQNNQKLRSDCSRFQISTPCLRAHVTVQRGAKTTRTAIKVDNALHDGNFERSGPSPLWRFFLDHIAAGLICINTERRGSVHLIGYLQALRVSFFYRHLYFTPLTRRRKLKSCIISADLIWSHHEALCASCHPRSHLR